MQGQDKGLIQVGGPKEVVAIDVLVPGIDLAPLNELFADPKLLKVFHSGRQDMEIFFHANGWLPAPVFDTQIAAMVCGFGDSVAYDKLAQQLAGAKLDKASRFADWSRRPLTDRQLRYALADVDHLRPIYQALAKMLGKNGRSEWLADEMAILTDPETYRLEPETAWARLKTRSTEPRYLAVLRALAAWRETEAQRRDVPRGRILRDEQLFDIAAHTPQTPEALGRTRGLGADFARGKMGRGIIEAVKAGLAVPPEERPKAPPRVDLPRGLGPIIDLLKVLLKMKSEEHKVAQRLIANSADLEYIAADDNAPVAALKGWRRAIFGAEALALKRGELALSIQKRRVKLVPVGDRS